MREIKYIILKDNQGKLRHFKSDFTSHYCLAENNGYDSSKIILCGVILDGKTFILECQDLEHLYKRSNRFIGGNDYQDIRLKAFFRGRELESLYSYGIVREGD
jgi:hypothetical protein